MDPAGSKAPPDRAGASGRAWLVMLSVLVVALAGDLLSKWLAFERVAGQPVVTSRAQVLEAGPGGLWTLIPRHEAVVVVPKVLNLTLVYNPGAVFGIGAGQRWFFVAFTMVAVGVGILVFARGTGRRDHGSHTALALILAGGLGNLYDRLVFACVRDFLHPLPGVNLPFSLRWPGGSREAWPWVSNLADLWLIIGVGLLLLLSLKRK